MSDKQYHEASDTENRNDIVANFDEKPWNCFYGIAADGVLHTSIQYSGETLSRTSFDHEGWCDSAETPSCLQSFRSQHFTPSKRGEPLMAETCKRRMKINIQRYGNITMILPWKIWKQVKKINTVRSAARSWIGRNEHGYKWILYGCVVFVFSHWLRGRFVLYVMAMDHHCIQCVCLSGWYRGRRLKKRLLLRHLWHNYQLQASGSKDIKRICFLMRKML